MYVLVVGAGRTGARLCEALLADGHRVVVVDKDPHVAERLARRLEGRGLRVVRGDGNDPGVLGEAGAREARAIAAVTGEDEDNLAVGLLGKREFGVPRIVAKINNPLNAWLFTRTMGVDVAVDPADVIAHLLEEEASVGEIVTLLKLRQGGVSLVEVVLMPDWPVVGRTLGDLALPADTAVVALARDGRVLVPRADLALRPGDEVVALCTPAAEADLVRALKGA